MPGFHRLSDIHLLSYPVTPSGAVCVCVCVCVSAYMLPYAHARFLGAFLRLMDIFLVTRNCEVVKSCAGGGPFKWLIG